MNRKKVVVLLLLIGLATMLIGIFILFNSNPIKDNDDKKDDNADLLGKVFGDVYNKIKISDTMNGYKVMYSLVGQYKEEKYLDAVVIENYMNKKYRVMEEHIDDKGNVIAESDVYYIIDGITYLEKDNNEYQKVDAGIIYNNTEVYLKGLINAHKISQDKEKLGEKEYDKYAFSITASVMKEILKNTTISDMSFDKDNIECGVWIDESGYIYRLEYDLSTGMNSEEPISIVLFLMDYNNSKDILIPIE